MYHCTATSMAKKRLYNCRLNVLYRIRTTTVQHCRVRLSRVHKRASKTVSGLPTTKLTSRDGSAKVITKKTHQVLPRAGWVGLEERRQSKSVRQHPTCISEASAESDTRTYVVIMTMMQYDTYIHASNDAMTHFHVAMPIVGHNCIKCRHDESQ